MKRFISFLLIIMLVSSVFSVMTVSAFAAESSAGDVVENTKENVGALTEKLKGLLDKVKAYVPMEKLEAFKNEATIFVKALIAFVKSDETYKNIATAILGVLAFLFIPVIIGLVVIAYAIVGIATVFASVLVKVVEVILAILVGMLPF